MPCYLPAGVVAVAASAAVVAAALWLQDYTATGFLVLCLFAFPVPVACGYAAGLVSPRGAVVWGPVWACVFALIAFTLLAGAVDELVVAKSSMRLVLMPVGAALAVLAALAGRRVADKRHVLAATSVFVFLCVSMGIAQCLLVSRSTETFERTVAPRILLELDRDYVEVPAGMDWRCRRHRTLKCYELSARVMGERMSVLVDSRAPGIIGMNYVRRGDGRGISDDDAALRYLLDLGFREKLLSTLSRTPGTAGPWQTGLGRTSLTLSSDGSVTVRTLPLPYRTPFRAASSDW